MSKISERLAAIRARCDAATPGPWRRGIGNQSRLTYSPHKDIIADAGPVNGTLIAHARADVPALLAVAEAAARLAGLASPWWAWGECVGCGAEAGPPNLTGYNHADDCPALALDAALAALGGGEVTDGS